MIGSHYAQFNTFKLHYTLRARFDVRSWPTPCYNMITRYRLEQAPRGRPAFRAGPPRDVVREWSALLDQRDTPLL